MTDAAPTATDLILLVVLPYVALVLLVIVSISRYRSHPFSYSSLSSQFLENRRHFWALVPFHYGILFVLAGHLLALLVPRSILIWNGDPLRLALLEGTGLAFAIIALIGLVRIMTRRSVDERVRVVTTPMDWLLYVVLLVQIVSGIFVAVWYPWGSSWYAGTAVPYIWSLARLQPDISFIQQLPWPVQLHIVNAWVFIALAPFTRMAHAFVAPFPYLWRRRQVVRWWRA